MYRILPLAIAAFALAPATAAQTVIFQEGFEGPSAAYTVQGGFGTATGANNANGSYFARGDGDNLSLDASRNNGQFANEQGDFVFSGRQTNATVNTLRAVVFSPVDVSGEDGVTISFLAGANSAGTYEFANASNDDFLKLQYRLDGGAYQNCVSFAGISDEGSPRPLRRDLDNDGTGDVVGDDLNETLRRYNCGSVVDVSGASSLQVRVTTRTTASSEQVVFDDIVVSAVSPLEASIISPGNCGTPSGGVFFSRPSPTTRCFPILQGTNSSASAQRYTLFFVIEQLGSTYTRVAMRGEIKLGPGESATNKFSLRTFDFDPDGNYDLVLLAELGSVPAPTGSAVELDRVQFTKGGGAPALRATEALTAYPNPAADAATLRFAVAEATEATLVVYDALGREVARLVEGAVSGQVEVALDASALPAGLYVARLAVDGRTETVRFSVAR